MNFPLGQLNYFRIVYIGRNRNKKTEKKKLQAVVYSRLCFQKNFIYSKILNNCVCSVICNAAHILISFYFHVAVLTPATAPPIFQYPIVGRVTDGQHCVIDLGRCTRRIIINAMRIQLECLWAGINRNGNRAHRGNGIF